VRELIHQEAGPNGKIKRGQIKLTESQRPWIRQIWKQEHPDITVVVEPKDSDRLEELIAEHGEVALVVSWHQYVTEVTDGDGEAVHYAHYKLRPVTYVLEKVAKTSGKPYFDTAESTREITTRPFRSFLAVSQSFIEDVKDLPQQDLIKRAEEIVR
jgi:hypothetical protein